MKGAKNREFGSSVSYSIVSYFKLLFHIFYAERANIKHNTPLHHYNFVMLMDSIKSSKSFIFI